MSQKKAHLLGYDIERFKAVMLNRLESIYEEERKEDDRHSMGRSIELQKKLSGITEDLSNEKNTKMGLHKGLTGNNGRPKGSPNKVTVDLRA
jgi:hypothetical protein